MTLFSVGNIIAQFDGSESSVHKVRISFSIFAPEKAP